MSLYKRKAPRKYSLEFKKESAKLGNEIGKQKAAAELGVPEGTLYGWMKNFTDETKSGEKPSKGNENILILMEEIKQLKAENKAISKANALLRKENDFLEEASAFFAASRQKLAKKRE